MAKPILNSSLKGLSGAVDGWVYRHRRGLTFVSRRPGARTGAPTSAQLEHRERFKDASNYAKLSTLNPATLAFYTTLAKAQDRSARAAMMADFFNPPEIKDLIVAGYDRSVGSKVQVKAFDDAEVVLVKVAIAVTDGPVIEEGDAVLENGVWFYTATVTAPADPLTITATAFDRPGNSGVRMVTTAA